MARDLEDLFSAISKCIGRKVNSEEDSIHISKPNDWSTRSAAEHIVRCQINKDRYVILKRCADNPEFIRREEIIAQAKCKLKWVPAYSVVKIQGIKLRSTKNGENYELAKGWEDKTILVIDIGNYELAKNLNQLEIKDIEDLEWFCFCYGQWAAFNYLFSVRDRNGGNFVFFTDTQTLHSIDNEEGPFDSRGKNAGVLDIVASTQHHIQRFIENKDKKKLVKTLQHGFEQGWGTIKGNISSLSMLNDKEKTVMENLLKDKPKEIAEIIFNE